MRVGIYEGRAEAKDLRGSWLGGDDYLKGGKRNTESRGLLLKEMVIAVSYSGKRIKSQVNPKIELTVLGDEIEDKVLGVLVGVRGEKGVKNVAFLREGGSPKKTAFMVVAELEEEINPSELEKELKEVITKKYGEIEGETYPLAGAFIGGTEGKKYVVIPFSTYKPKEVIPAFTGEENEEIEKLEAELERLNNFLANEKDEKKAEEIRKQRKELLAKLAKERAKLYRPDLLKAVVQKSINGEEIWLINRKSEIRAMGENLLEGAKVGLDIGADRGVFAFISFPSVNNFSNELMTSTLTLALAVGNEWGIEVLDTYKARDYLRKLARGIREIIEAIETETKPPTFAEEENLSLRKRLSDLAKFLSANIGALGEVEKGLAELEKGIRLLYSPFTVKDLYTRTDAIRDLTDRGVDIRQFSSEEWGELNDILKEVNTRLEEGIKNQKNYDRLFKAFYGAVKEGRGIKLKVKENGEVKEVYYPTEKPTIWDWTFSNRFVGIVEKTLEKLQADLNELQFSYFFKEVEVQLSESAIKKAIARKLLKDIAKTYLEELQTVEPWEILNLEKMLKARWKGEFLETQNKKPVSEIEDVDLDFAEGEEADLDKLLYGEEPSGEINEDLDDFLL